jgi:hypothetical protein
MEFENIIKYGFGYIKKLARPPVYYSGANEP